MRDDDLAVVLRALGHPVRLNILRILAERQQNQCCCTDVMACLPLALGSVSLSLIGRFDETARLPVVWALAGAAMAGVPSLVLNEGATPESTAFVAAFAWTGAACALIARAGTRWSDD